MIGQAHGISSAVKSLAGVHPIALGVVVGVSAYYAIDKYLLNDDMDDELAGEIEADEVETAT